MSTSTPAPKPVSGPRMVIVMGSVGLVASVLLVLTYNLTLPRIEANRAAYLAASITEVLPAAARFQAWVVTPEGGLEAAPAKATSGRVFAGYDASDTFVGVAVEAAGQGYQDILRILYGYDPHCACVVGMKVLESKETPGLGDKIEKDPAFTANFDSLALRLQDELATVELVKRGAGTEPWHVEAITGATISSRAIAEIIAKSSAGLVPVLAAHLDELRTPRPQ